MVKEVYSIRTNQTNQHQLFML